MNGSQRLFYVAASVAIIGLVASCSTSRSFELTKSGVSEEQERVDWGLCGGNFDAKGKGAAPNDFEETKACMEGKGYTFRWTD